MNLHQRIRELEEEVKELKRKLLYYKKYCSDCYYYNGFMKPCLFPKCKLGSDFVLKEDYE